MPAGARLVPPATNKPFLVLVLLLLRVVGYSITSTSMSRSMSRNSWSDSLPDLTGIAYRRKALAKLRLLSLSFASLLRLARRLLGVRTWTCAADQQKDKSRRKNDEN